MTATPSYLVTGANKGIGFYIARGIAQAYARQNAPVTVLLGARNPELGKKAEAEINKELGGAVQNGVKVQFVRVDLLDKAGPGEGLQKSVDEIGGILGGNGLNVLVNNAGHAYKGDAFGRDVAFNTIQTNLHGTVRVTQAFTPLLLKSSGARVVNVCSSAGLLDSRKYSPELLQRWQEIAEKGSYQDVDKLTAEFIEAAGDESYQAKGWPRQTYAVSKAAEITATKIGAREHVGKIWFSACCPGWCKSDMAGWDRPTKTAEQGSETPVWLALDGSLVQNPSGRMYREGQEIRWAA